MKFPDVDIPITPVRIPWSIVEKAALAAERVWERMYRAATALTEADVPFVCIGGNAVGLWVATRDEGAVRNTRDVDILMNRADLNRAADAMALAGFDLNTSTGWIVFVDRSDPVPSRGVHIHFAGERLNQKSNAIAPAVDVGLVYNGIPIPSLSQLVNMKLIAFRNIDRVHIRDLINAGLIEPKVVAACIPDLRKRLEDIITDPNG